MGLENKVTAERYRIIKSYVEKHESGASDDVAVGKIFGVGATVVRTVRNTRTYEEYLSKGSTYRQRKAKRRKRKNATTLKEPGLPSIGVPFSDQKCINNTIIMRRGFRPITVLILVILFIIVAWLVCRMTYGV